MNAMTLTSTYRRTLLDYHAWRAGAGIGVKLVLAASFAALTGMMAQIAFYLPWTPVPITGQTFAVILGGLLLGRWGALSQGLYAGAGLAGIPWFAGARGGVAVLFGPTAGYLVGFVVAAYVVGAYVDRRGRRAVLPLAFLMLSVNFAVILGIGAAYLFLWLNLIQGRATGVEELLMMGVIPFIPGAVVKTLLAAGAAYALFPGDTG